MNQESKKSIFSFDFVFKRIIFLVMRQLYKLVILGDGGVGKTTTIHSVFQYLKNKFTTVSYKSDQKETITDLKNVHRTKFIDFHAISFMYNTQKIVWQIWDLQGQRFPSNNSYTSLNPLDHITETIVKNADLILLTYDSSNNATFNELFREGGFYELVKPFVTDNQNFLLLATKTDLKKEKHDDTVQKLNLGEIFDYEPETISFNNTFLENISVLSEKILDILSMNNQKSFHPMATTNQSVSLKVYR